MMTAMELIFTKKKDLTNIRFKKKKKNKYERMPGNKKNTEWEKK